MDEERNGAAPRGRNLILCSDGTGNRASRANGTNVWRLYEALDRRGAGPAGTGRVDQLATHDDGVGTSSNSLLKMLGGAFGYGLKANVLQLYAWLANNYRPGDRIYVFGFSRGAFTVRLLAGLVARCGVINGAKMPAKDLNARVNEAWLLNKRAQGKPVFAEADTFRRLHGSEMKQGSGDTDVSIHFVGVWDTVDAYGLPVDEAKEALALVSRWLQHVPLLHRFAVTRFDDRKLSSKVKNAYHAVALDDERHTFHPVLWNEKEEHEGQTIEQVWFAGMHSDVGGGYVRGSLSLEPLHWMLKKAQAKGLRFDATHLARFEKERSAAGPLHDSRSGMGVYYRYRPRNVAVLCKEHCVSPVRVHASVLERIELTGGDGLPDGLPETFEVEGKAVTSVARRPDPGALDAVRGVSFWRGGLYYAFLAWTVWLLTLSRNPVVSPQPGWGPLGKLFDLAEKNAPASLEAPIQSLRGQPFALLIALTLLLVMFRLRTYLSELNRKLVREAWGLDPQRDSYASKWIALGRGIQERVRRSATPAVKNVYGLAATAVIAFILATVLGIRSAEVVAADTTVPALDLVKVSDEPSLVDFAPSTRSLRTNLGLQAGVTYEFAVVVREPWKDATQAAGPGGLAAEPTFGMRLMTPFRHRWSEDWMVLLGSVAQVGPGGSGDDEEFVIGEGGRFTPRISGRLHLFVNDAAWYGPGGPWRLYENNQGSAQISVKRVLSD